MLRVELKLGHQGRHWAKLRPLTGEDEIALDPGDPDAVNILLSRLLVAAPGATVGPEGLAALSVADRDQLLAAVYHEEFGDGVDGVASCIHCGEKYEFSFSLSALIAHLTEDGVPHTDGPDAEGFYGLPNGVRFRLPTVRDVEGVAGLPAEAAVSALLERCLAGPAGAADREALQAAMERVAPILNLDIESVCPHCAAAQGIAFNIESYLLQALAQERRFLTHEIHRLAISYGWGLRDILGISREDRRSLIRHIEYLSAPGARG
jgi:hypothetical protein